MPEVISAPRVVKIPQHNDDRKWPNLADIPKDKPAFSTMAERKVDNDHLVSDKFKADAQIARIQNIYVPLPPGQQQEIDNANTNNTKLKVNQDDMPQRIYKPFSALRP